MKIYPMHFEPIYKTAIWGGTRILKKYKRKSCLNKVSESWEIVDRKSNVSKVVNGSYKDKSLHELVQKYPQELLGKNSCFDRFPFLIKILDAHENLSVQVHPDEKMATKMHVEAKNEAWYILEAKQNSFVYAGLKPEVDRKAFEDALDRGRVLELLKQIEVQKEDAIYIPGGTIHAICGGCLLLEVQQNSDTTYRIYDWDRVNENLEPRKLHIENALQVIHFDDKKDCQPQPLLAYRQDTSQVWDLVKSPFFRMQRLDIEDEWHLLADHESFQIFFLLDGKATLFANDEQEKMKSGTSYLTAAAADTVLIQANPKCRIIKISLP